MTTNERKPETDNSERSALRDVLRRQANDMISPTPRNILGALGGRLRVEPKNIHIDEIVDELGLCTGAYRDYVRHRVASTMEHANVPCRAGGNGPVYFPEAI